MLFLRLRAGRPRRRRPRWSSWRPTPTVAHPATPRCPGHPAGRRPGPGPGPDRRRRAAAGLRVAPRGPGVVRTTDLAGRPRLGTGDGDGGPAVVVVVGPAVGGRARRRRGAEAARVLAARAARRPASCRPCAGATCIGALDMGLAPGLLPGPGRRSAAGRPGSPPPGARSPRRPGCDAAGVLASLAGPVDRGGSGRPRRALVLLGADLLDDFPDRHLAARRSAAAEFVVAVTGHARAPVGPRRRGAAGRRRPRAAGHDHQHRGPGHPARARSWWPRAGLAGLDDRRRAGRRARRRPRADEPRRRCGTRSSGWPRPTPASRGHVLERRTRPRRRSWCPLGAGGPGRRRVEPIDPMALPGRGVGRAPGRPAPGRAGRAAGAARAATTTAAPDRSGAAVPRRPGPADVGPGPAGRPHVPAIRQLLAAPGLGPPALRRRAARWPARRRWPRWCRPAGGPGQPLRPRPAGRGHRRPGPGALGPAVPWCCRPRPTPGCPGGWWPSTSTCRRDRRAGQRRGHRSSTPRPPVNEVRMESVDDALLPWSRGRSAPTAIPSTPTAWAGSCWVVERHQGAGGLRRAAGVGHADDLVRAQGHLGHAEPDRPQPGRALGAPPDAGRRDQAVLQGGPAARREADRFVFKLAPYLSCSRRC